MSNLLNSYAAQRPSSPNLKQSRMMLPFGYEKGYPANPMAEEVWFKRLADLRDGESYETLLDNSSTIASVDDGRRLTTQASPSDADDMAINGEFADTLAAGKIWTLFARFRLSDVDLMGIRLGFHGGASNAEIFTAAPTDGIYLVKAETGTDLTLRTVENGNAAADLSTFNLSNGTNAAFTLADATDITVHLKFEAGDSAATSWGEVWLAQGEAEPVKTSFTAAQVADVYAMLTTAPTLRPHIGFRLEGTAQKNATVCNFKAYCER